jgi:chemotaxis protein MotB
MMTRPTTLALILAASLLSCVSTKKLEAVQNKLNEAETSITGVQRELRECRDAKAELEKSKATLESRIAGMTDQMDMLRQNNNQALRQLQDLSVISSAQAESIRKSLDNIGAKDSYIQTLQQQMARKDSLNMNLVMNLKGAIGNINDEDINIRIDKGVVYVDISDKLLFKSGNWEVTEPAALEILGKVAAVLKNQPDIEFMVEGHTDDVPFAKGVLVDNWDLSAKRATTVVRLLQKQYGMDPAKMAAAARAEYKPVADNASPDGKSANRRTRIVILPQLDQFFKLLEKPGA